MAPSYRQLLRCGHLKWWISLSCLHVGKFHYSHIVNLTLVVCVCPSIPRLPMYLTASHMYWGGCQTPDKWKTLLLADDHYPIGKLADLVSLADGLLKKTNQNFFLCVFLFFWLIHVLFISLRKCGQVYWPHVWKSLLKPGCDFGDTSLENQQLFWTFEVFVCLFWSFWRAAGESAVVLKVFQV